MKYSIIFDTNQLYNSYDNGGFSELTLNKNFENIVTVIEELNLINTVEVVVPKFVLRELKKQYIDKLYTSLNQDITIIENKKYPILSLNIEGQQNLTVNKNRIVKIADEKLDKYLLKLENYSVKVRIIPTPKENIFNNIMNRAIDKLPPFGNPPKDGKKDSSSDKGFKDVVIWESALEYKKKYDTKLILYTKDNILRDNYVENEYKELFDERLETFSKESELITFLNKIPTSERDSSDLEEGSISFPEDYNILREFFDRKELKLLIIEELADRIFDGYIEDIIQLEIDINDINEVDLKPSEISIYSEIARKYYAKLKVNLNLSNGNVYFEKPVQIGMNLIVDKEFSDLEKVFNEIKVDRIELIKNE
ncbi:PIN domain-containing protein [Carnobacterium maltaromaticum]|uniref:PIN domain-containing protein n=1 Tax=Carnobacterium maltaromaticum TaxID=2751 RepID=UPI00295F52A2|nr:PIN domain-containing protein [Carnobacterium maltaromaticum]